MARRNVRNAQRDEEKCFQNWVWALLQVAKQESFYQVPQAPSQSHCSLHPAFLLPTPEELQPSRWSCMVRFSGAAGLISRLCSPSPKRGAGNQLLPSLHTSLSHTSPGRINRFHCVSNPAFSLFPQPFADSFNSLPLGRKKKRTKKNLKRRQLVQFCLKISDFI